MRADDYSARVTVSRELLRLHDRPSGLSAGDRWGDAGRTVSAYLEAVAEFKDALFGRPTSQG